MKTSLYDYCVERNYITSLRQWHPTLNDSLTPQMVTTGSHRMIWWQCPQGHVWKAAIHSRAGPQKCGCPVCAGRVKPERLKRYVAFTAERSTGPGLFIKCEPLEQRAPNHIHKR